MKPKSLTTGNDFVKQQQRPSITPTLLSLPSCKFHPKAPDLPLNRSMASKLMASIVRRDSERGKEDSLNDAKCDQSSVSEDFYRHVRKGDLL